MVKDIRFHLFNRADLHGVKLPHKFTNPFYYEPHDLCRLASQRVMSYIYSRPEWRSELDSGKMMGVMVVRKGDKIGYLAAYSGNLYHTGYHTYFVPAVCDLLSNDSFFAIEEKIITDINLTIDNELSDKTRVETILRLEQCRSEAEKSIGLYKNFMREAKIKRDSLRIQGVEESYLIAESQHQKAEFRRIKKHWAELIEKYSQVVKDSDRRIEKLKAERQQRSIALQKLVFERFEMLNAHGKRRNLNEIFSDTSLSAPPSGAGECAAPKMLQYAFANNYQPLAMAEFWVGASPKGEVRHHGHFYPSCKSKCEPILKWMLQGLNVENNNLGKPEYGSTISILYEDEWVIAIDKPAGMLSVPGKLTTESLVDLVGKIYADSELHIVHRLDMSTSGILLFARSKHVYKFLQSMFKSRSIAKCYAAVLEGEVDKESGIINLPLTLNPEDRPRQMVSYKYGKPATTRYEVVGRKRGRSYVLFYPETGRTHQLRVHSSHQDGLNAPILGDMLYGNSDKRLHLHAHRLKFQHPITKQEVLITSPIPFEFG